MAASTEFVRAREPFSGDNYETQEIEDPVTGRKRKEKIAIPYVINPSEIFRSDDPIVKKHPTMFVPLEATRQRPEVEAATANPGERR